MRWSSVSSRELAVAVGAVRQYDDRRNPRWLRVLASALMRLADRIVECGSAVGEQPADHSQ